MSPEAQRIAIAEACGWTKCEHVASINLTKGIPPANNPPKYGTYENGMAQLPDYLNDLNAIQEAEKMLKGGMRSKYDAELTLICLRDYNFIWESTAAQRAEAFRKTLDIPKP